MKTDLRYFRVGLYDSAYPNSVIRMVVVNSYTAYDAAQTAVLQHCDLTLEPGTQITEGYWEFIAQGDGRRIQVFVKELQR